ncbi:vWA domain-containing protein [Pedobacter sp. GR22-6]|uniref:vWA domain-containing protein n=1 Tax=Pedobacter sp. GR22-6 TaxID=3127957 RepID=UPI00307EA322
MKKILLPMLIVLLFAAFKSGPSRIRTITGIVKEKNSGKPLPNVMVSGLSGKSKAKTNDDGKYAINIDDKESALVFSYIGFVKATIEVREHKVINVSLAAEESLREDVVLSFAEPKALSTSSSRTVLSSSEKVKIRGVAPVSESLAGRVAGIAMSKEKPFKKAPRPMLDEEIRPGRTEPRPQSNLLTAGEWNDVSHWDFWKDLMRNQEWSDKQSYWQFYTANRVGVRLKNKQQQALTGYTVTVLKKGTAVWKAQSNFEGKAELWPAVYSNDRERFTLTVNSADGTLLYNKDFAADVVNVEITLNRTAEKIKNLDVLFMVDATGSMGDEIAYLKSELEDIIGRLNRGNQLNTRTGLVFYRDQGDEYVVRDFGFDGNLMAVKANLSKQYASGGGDFEEAVEEAMESAIYQQQWTTERPSAKLMFMILDAPPHHDQKRIGSLQRSVKEAAAKGITLIPVVASGIDKNTEFLMRFMAMSTNGTYVFLTDDSGIGNSHLKPTTGSFQVEQLNALMNRLIRKYTGLDSNVAGELLSSSDK